MPPDRDRLQPVARGLYVRRMANVTPAAYGGEKWSPRESSLSEELGGVWAPCGVREEYAPLRAVLLHRPGAELTRAAADPDRWQMLAAPDPGRAAAQHDDLAAAYRAHGVDVSYVDPDADVPPNLMFVADLMFMTPSGAIVARPASTVRAGEERWVARRLAALGVPIIRSVGGRGTFEGADAMWLDEHTALVGRGMRTNAAGAAQVEATLAELGVTSIPLDVPDAAMHLMGQIRIIDSDLAFVADAGSAPAARVLREHGFTVHDFPDRAEMASGSAHNFVVLAPRRIVMPAGNPRSVSYYEALGIECVCVEVDELMKAAGAIGCLTGVLWRSQ
jgi:arginine deiminase